MEQKDLDFIRKFERAKKKQGLRSIGILFLLALTCCSIYILLDVIKNGTVEVTLPYFFKKFSFSFFICSVIYFASYYDMRRKYKKLKEKE
jgi:dolichyl-phosphate-mannose--protein O-mannosyl transferase